MQNRPYFHRIREDYQQAVQASGEAYQNIGRQLSPLLRGRVLDFGSGGVANYSTALLESLRCVDIMPPPPTDDADHVSWEEGDFYAYPFTPWADRVLVQFLLHHLPDDQRLEAALRRLANALPPGGQLVVVEMLLPPLGRGLQALARPLIRAGLGLLGKPDLRFFSLQSLTVLLSRAGFVLLTAETINLGQRVAPAPVLFPRWRIPGRYHPLRCVLLTAEPRRLSAPAQDGMPPRDDLCPACSGAVSTAMPLGPFTLRGCRDCGCWWSDALSRHAPLSFTPTNYFSQPDGDRPRWQGLLWRLPTPPQAVLDVGCGTGAFLGFLAQALPGARRVGVELDPERAAAAAAGHPDAAICQGDGAAVLAASTESFDLITLWDVFEHVPDPARLLQTLAPRLAPGGRIFIQTIHEDSLVPRLGRLSYWLTGGRMRRVARRTHDAHHLSFFTRAALQHLAGRAGLEVQTVWFDRLAQDRMDGPPWVTWPTAALLALENAWGNGLFLNVILTRTASPAAAGEPTGGPGA